MRPSLPKQLRRLTACRTIALKKKDGQAVPEITMSEAFARAQLLFDDFGIRSIFCLATLQSLGNLWVFPKFENQREKPFTPLFQPFRSATACKSINNQRKLAADLVVRRF